MSKSIGNVISPNEVMQKYGADILRLWVASSDYDGDIKLSPEILERLADGYRKIRNTFRYLLSNLNDFDPSKNSVKINEMSELDRWMLSRLARLLESVNSYYESCEFHKVYRSVYVFCVFEVSAFYLDVLKDILYIVAPDSRERRAGQTVLAYINDVLVRVLAPILVFTSEEVWQHMQIEGKRESVHMADWPGLDGDISSWRDEELDKKWGKILEIRDSVTKFLEEKRKEDMIGSSLDARLLLFSSDSEEKKFLEDNLEIFPLVFRVSQVSVIDDEKDGMEQVLGYPVKVKVGKALGDKCPRCWNYSEYVGKNPERPELCERCCKAMSERS